MTYGLFALLYLVLHPRKRPRWTLSLGPLASGGVWPVWAGEALAEEGEVAGALVLPAPYQASGGRWLCSCPRRHSSSHARRVMLAFQPPLPRPPLSPARWGAVTLHHCQPPSPSPPLASLSSPCPSVKSLHGAPRSPPLMGP